MDHNISCLSAVCNIWAIRPEVLNHVARSLGNAGPSLHFSARYPARVNHGSNAAGTAVIPIHGVLTHRPTLLSLLLSSGDMQSIGLQIEQAAKDRETRRILLDFNTTGGTSYGAQELAATIRAARQQKPVVAVVNSLAEGTGYWIASAASEIVITQGGSLGGIGIVAVHQDWSMALNKQGINVSLISAGKFKTEGNPYEPLADKARAATQKRVDEIYDAFVRDVARGRAVMPSLVRDRFGGGRAVLAQDAVHLGMADRIASLKQVLNEAPESNRTSDRGGSSASRRLQHAKHSLALVEIEHTETASKAIRTLFAHHESAHAVAAHLLGCRNVQIHILEKEYRGLTQFSDVKNHHAALAIAMAGPIAEALESGTDEGNYLAWPDTIAAATRLGIPLESSTLVCEAYRAARSIVFNHWLAIARLAQQVVERGFVYQPDVEMALHP